MITLCQVCDGTIDDDRIRAAQSRSKPPRYCSDRCYRAGIKRTYRAKRGSVAPTATGERASLDQPNPTRSVEGAVTWDEIREEARPLALRLLRAFEEHGI